MSYYEFSWLYISSAIWLSATQSARLMCRLPASYGQGLSIRTRPAAVLTITFLTCTVANFSVINSIVFPAPKGDNAECLADNPPTHSLVQYALPLPCLGYCQVFQAAPIEAYGQGLSAWYDTGRCPSMSYRAPAISIFLASSSVDVYVYLIWRMIDVIIACSEKKNHFLFHSLNRNFFVTLDKLLHLGIKNEWIHFVLLSF